jgi:hypothetical protein
MAGNGALAGEFEVIRVAGMRGSIAQFGLHKVYPRIFFLNRVKKIRTLRPLIAGWSSLAARRAQPAGSGSFHPYGSDIHLVEAGKRQRKPRASSYRDAWELILHWAACRETGTINPVKFGEAVGEVIPSQALQPYRCEEGVET